MPGLIVGMLPLRLAQLGQRGTPYLAKFEHLPNILTAPLQVPPPVPVPATTAALQPQQHPQQNPVPQQHLPAAPAAAVTQCTSSLNHTSSSSSNSHKPTTTTLLLHAYRPMCVSYSYSSLQCWPHWQSFCSSLQGPLQERDGPKT